MRDRLRVVFCLCFLPCLGLITAADPCPPQSDGLKCDYIPGLAHDNSEVADEVQLFARFCACVTVRGCPT